MAAAERGSSREEPRRMHQDSGCALNQRLEYECCNLVPAPLELFFQLGESVSTVCPRRTWNRDALNEKWTEDPMKELDASNSDGSKRVAMVGVR
jgi:hypothetical protein